MKTSTQQWLDFAKADLLNCERILDDDFLTAIVAFHRNRLLKNALRHLLKKRT